jgi:hypothetical protein
MFWIRRSCDVVALPIETAPTTFDKAWFVA